MSSQAEFKIEHDVELDKITIIELSEQEIKEIEKARKIGLELSKKELAENDAKETAKSAILNRLGLSADELQVLLG